MNDHKVIETMMEYGDLFARRLGAVALVANESDLRKIKDTWSDQWAQYSYMAQKISEVERQASGKHNNNNNK